MLTTYIVFLIHIANCYSKEYLTNYTLTPLAHGYYFSNNPTVNWYAARQNCYHFNLELASIFDEEDYVDIQDAFLMHPIWDSFIGASEGLFLSALGTKPWNADAFAWDVNGKNYPMKNYKISAKLWAPGQPDNENPNEQCTVVYMLADDNINLGMADVQCTWDRGFLCQIPAAPGEGLKAKPKYQVSVVGDKSFVLRKATWAKAVQECARRNKTQLILSTKKAEQNFIDTYYDAGFLDDDEAVWTSASSLGAVDAEDLSRMPNAKKFRWPDHWYYEDIPNPVEQCLAFSKDKGLHEELCIKNLSFICAQPEVTKCHQIEFDIIKFDQRKFHYSNHSLLNWGDALMCCASRQQRLISVATPIVGNLLANYFQSNKLTAGRHSGFKYGIWTSGNVLSYGSRLNSTFEFASSYERIDLKDNGVNHYMQGPNAFKGECLTFLIDDGVVRSYILSNISCALHRSFVCEEGVRLKDIKSMTWLGVPHYPDIVYVNSTATWQEAFQACTLANMTLITIENDEENDMALEILQSATKPGENPWMIWLGATRLDGITLYPDFTWLTLNKTVTYAKWVFGVPDKYYPHEWCMNGFVLNGKFVWDDIDCQQKMHFMCRTKERGKIDSDATTTTTTNEHALPSYIVSDPNDTVHSDSAQNKCVSRDMELVSILSEAELKKLTKYLMEHNDKNKFVGLEGGLYTSAVGQDPWNKLGFAWNIDGKNQSMSDYPIVSKLWAPGQPDNGDPLEQCTAIYFLENSSENEFKLAMDDIQCGQKRRYICQIYPNARAFKNTQRHRGRYITKSVKKAEPRKKQVVHEAQSPNKVVSQQGRHLKPYHLSVKSKL